MATPGRSWADTPRVARTRRPVVDSLEDRTLLSPFTVGGDPSVNPSDFRITTFASGLNYPDAMLTLSDGSMLVGVSNAGGSTGYGNSSGKLLRFVDANGAVHRDGRTVTLERSGVGALLPADKDISTRPQCARLVQRALLLIDLLVVISTIRKAC